MPKDLGVERSGAAQLGGRRVLIADDYPDTVESLAVLLRERGFNVHTARDGEEARREVLDWGPDVCLLDLSMPSLDGCDLARWIHTRCGRARPFLIALTGWGRHEDRLRVREAGFDRHWTKPADPAELIALLEGTRHGGRSPPAKGRSP